MAGIGRIENRLKNKLETQDKNISVAFKDLSQLMTFAKEMTQLSKSIASKIKEHGSQVTNDETIRFRSHLMELGIEQQIDVGLGSKSSYSNSSSYYEELAKQMSLIITPLMERKKQDQLTLSDVYCCFNRARGMDLVSPDDIMEGCKLMEKIPELQLRLVKYSSGLMVVQKLSCDIEAILDKTLEMANQASYLTPLQLASRMSIPIQLARQRLREAEAAGKLCRDESIEGLKFYPNKFLLESYR